MAVQWVGRPMARLEDVRLLRGKGHYVADMRLPGTLQLAILRSPHAHARIRRIDIAEAAAVPGVVRVVTAADLAGQVRVPPGHQPVLAGSAVHYAGEPVAAVLAEDRYSAEDACERIRVEYEPLPAVVDADAALAEGAPPAVEGLDNLAARFLIQAGTPEEAFAQAEIVVEERLRVGRASAHPLETRGILVAPDPMGEGLQVWCTTQAPHDERRALADVLGLAEPLIRVRTPDVGGGFGVKNGAYPEDFLAAWLALQLGRPVQFIEDRHEHFLATVHEREQVHDCALAARRDGTLLGLRVRYRVDSGAYFQRGAPVAVLTALTMPGPYRLPAFQAECLVVRTNKTPIGPYRGAGRPQGCFVMERMMDRLAQALGLDRAEVRRRNLIQPDQFPYDTGLRHPLSGAPTIYDSGNYPACLDKALERIGYAGFAEEQRRARAEGRYLGLGIACNVEDTGGAAPFEGARVHLDGRGMVHVFSGSPAQGQGHETIFAQIVADTLGLTPEEIHLDLGDTNGLPLGIGTFGSRSTVLAGNAVRQAALEVKRQIAEWAAQILEAAPEDIEVAGGRAFVRGAPSSAVSLAQVAALANPVRPGSPLPPGARLGIEATHYFRPEGPTYSSGAQAVVVEFDPATCLVRPLRYVVVHDCGRMINPMLVEGQIHGGVQHGLSTVLLEEFRYDEEGQPQTATYMDYLIPTAVEVPRLEIEHLETPSPRNPEGVKGAGESGTIPALPVLASAIEDAMSPWGVRLRELPATPERLFRLLQEAKADRGHRQP